MEDTSKKAPFIKKKEGETHQVSYQPYYKPYHPYQPHHPYQPPYQPPHQAVVPYQSPYQALPYRPPSSISTTNAISISSTPRSVQIQPNPITTSQATPSNTAPSNAQAYTSNRNYRPRPPITPIPLTYTELYPLLLERHLVAPIFIRPLEPLIHVGMMSMPCVPITAEQLDMTWKTAQPLSIRCKLCSTMGKYNSMSMMSQV
ncbi:hypothetical protein PTKIN_Ptkin14bG0072100 [Pterospermum kingtungense]